jgi:hypothetical protein
MIDFLRANPFVSRDEYMWSWSLPQIHLAGSDFTHVKHLSEKEAEAKKNKANTINSVEDLLKSGIPTFK